MHKQVENRPLKIVMLTHDVKIDRRILLEAESLQSVGFEVVIIAMANEKGEEEKAPVKVIRTQTIGKSLTAKKSNDFLVNLYQSWRNKLYPYPRLQRWLHQVAWGLIWLKLCIKDKKVKLVSPPEYFYDGLYYDLALSEKGDIYVAHDLTMLATTAKCAQQLNAKLIYDSHEIFPEQSLGFLEKVMWRRLERKYIHHARQIITVNPSLANFLTKKYFLKQVHVIYNAEKVFPLHQNPERIFNHTFDLPNNSKIVLYQGSFLSDRNLIRLVLSMRHVTDQTIKLILLGNGHLQQKLMQTINKYNLQTKVFIHPEVPQAQLLKYTMSADVGLIPYTSNCLNNKFCTPNKLFEFIIAGLPIIASDLPELRALVYDKQIGDVVNAECEYALANKIEAFLADVTHYERIKANLLKVRELVNWQVEAKKLVQIYQNLN